MRQQSGHDLDGNTRPDQLGGVSVARHVEREIEPDLSTDSAD